MAIGFLLAPQKLRNLNYVGKNEFAAPQKLKNLNYVGECEFVAPQD